MTDTAGQVAYEAAVHSLTGRCAYVGHVPWAQLDETGPWAEGYCREDFEAAAAAVASHLAQTLRQARADELARLRDAVLDEIGALEDEAHAVRPSAGDVKRQLAERLRATLQAPGRETGET